MATEWKVEGGFEDAHRLRLAPGMHLRREPGFGRSRGKEEEPGFELGTGTTSIEI